MHSFVLIFCFFISSIFNTLVAAGSLASSSSGSGDVPWLRRVVTQPEGWVECEAEVPHDIYFIDLPFERKDFESLNALCKATYQRTRSTVGCQCSDSGKSVNCLREKAGLNPILWDSEFIRGYCEQNCKCYDEEQLPWKDEGYLLMERMRRQMELHYAQQDWVDKRRKEPFRKGSRRGTPGSSGGSSGTFFGSGASTPREQCSSHLPCSSMKDCYACGGECKGMTVDPRTRLWQMACTSPISSSSWGLKKRDDMPCACNSTYVGMSCCEAAGGLVWENPDLYLGQVRT